MEIFARVFERSILTVQKPGGCRLWLDSDPLDGRLYTTEELYYSVQPFFAKPWEFFKDFAYPGAPNLRPAAESSRDRGKDYDSLVFDTPLPTEWDANNRVPFKWFYDPENRSEKILLIAPGWLRATERVEFAFARDLVRRGIDVGIMTVPFHHERTPRGSYSGEYFISQNLFWTIVNFRQFAAEIRLLVQYMRGQYDHVGIIGLSSGGFQAGLASLGESIDFLFPIMTGCRLGSIVFSSALARRLCRDISSKGVDEESLNKVWSITDMLCVGHACKAKYRKQYVTRFDSIIPLEFQDALWDVYGKPERRDLNASHYSIYFSFRGIANDIASYVTRCLPRRGATSQSKSSFAAGGAQRV